jgi:hypothetical protein
LGYKYYGDNLIKLAILSVGCLGIFWDELRGKGTRAMRLERLFS